MSESRDDRTYRVDVHIHGITDVVGPLMGLLEKIIQGQNELKQEIQTMSSTTTNSLANLQAAVANETTVNQSVLTLLTTLAAELAAASPTGDNPAIDAVVSTMQANAAALSQAVQANTPPPPAGP